MDKHGMYLLGWIAGTGLGISLALGHADRWVSGGPVGGAIVFGILSLFFFGIFFIEDI